MKTAKTFLVLMFAGWCLFGFTLSASPAQGGPPEELRRIAVFDPEVPTERRMNAVRAVGGREVRPLNLINAVAVVLPDAASERTLEALPGIVRIDEDLEIRAHASDVDIPWGVARIKAPDAWEASKGDKVRVAILDTGIQRDHPDLKEVVMGGKLFLQSPPYHRLGSEDWDDDHGHGTHVAGTVAAFGEIAGVAPTAHLYAGKVLDRNGSGHLSDLIAALEWCIEEEEKMQVVNMSLGASSGNDSLHDIIKEAYYDAGLVLVASAGNSGPGENTVSYPAAYLETIAVAASDSEDNIPSWSSRGEEVDITGPGVDVESTWIDSGYRTISGTSMAAPHVSGVAALVIAQKGMMDTVEMLELLADTVEDLGHDLTAQGTGLVRADWALAIEAELGNIEGVVKDEDGTAIEGSTIVVNGTGLSAITGSGGFYFIENVPAEQQNITASAEGYYSKTVSVTVLENETVIQNFVLTTVQAYTIEAIAEDGGVIEPSGDIVVDEGESQTFEINPDSGYEISDVKVDGDSVGAKSNYTFENVTDDHTIHAFFDIIPTYTVSGTVTDDEDNPLSGAAVTIQETELSDTADEDGAYSITNIEKGSYDITASKKGYISQKKNVEIDSDTTVDFVLEEAADSPVINYVVLTDISNPQWARVEVAWSVSSDIGLDNVVSKMMLDGEEIDLAASSVSGSESSGTHELRNRRGHGETYEIVVTVTDIDGNSDSEKKEITLH